MAQVLARVKPRCLEVDESEQVPKASISMAVAALRSVAPQQDSLLHVDDAQARGQPFEEAVVDLAIENAGIGGLRQLRWTNESSASLHWDNAADFAKNVT